MRNASKSLALLIAVAALAACKPQATENNVTITDINNAQPGEIETLPADESSTTPSNELINGADNADLNTSNATGNGY